MKWNRFQHKLSVNYPELFTDIFTDISTHNVKFFRDAVEKEYNINFEHYTFPVGRRLLRSLAYRYIGEHTEYIKFKLLL